MYAKMEVIWFVIQLTHVSGHNEAESKKRKFKFRQNCFAKVVSDWTKVALLAGKKGYFNEYFLCKWHFTNLNIHFSLDFEQQNTFYKKQSLSQYFSSTCGRNMSLYG